VTGISSSSPDFVLPQVLSYPVSVAPGATIVVPLRFQPSTPGAKSATVTISTNDPSAPSKAITLGGVAPESYVCTPPVFASIDAAVGPTFGSGLTGRHALNASGHLLVPFGSERVFGAQLEADALFYPGRQEGQLDARLSYRRQDVQVSFGGGVNDINFHRAQSNGAVTHAALALDVLRPQVRFGVFAAKGIHEKHDFHPVDQIGGAVQFQVAPGAWLDGNVAYLRRRTPGGAGAAGAGVRVSKQFLPGIVGTVRVAVNESLLGPKSSGSLTLGLTWGHWPKPADYSNRVNPLGTFVPKIRYEVFTGR
jgi:hypothetical protein